MGTKQGRDWGIVIYYAAAVAGWLQRRSTPKLVPACRQVEGPRQQEGEAEGSGGPQQLEAGSCQACRRLGGGRGRPGGGEGSRQKHAKTFMVVS